jgi:hypothetical protein
VLESDRVTKLEKHSQSRRSQEKYNCLVPRRSKRPGYMDGSFFFGATQLFVTPLQAVPTPSSLFGISVSSSAHPFPLFAQHSSCSASPAWPPPSSLMRSA